MVTDAQSNRLRWLWPAERRVHAMKLYQQLKDPANKLVKLCDLLLFIYCSITAAGAVYREFLI